MLSLYIYTYFSDFVLRVLILHGIKRRSVRSSKRLEQNSIQRNKLGISYVALLVLMHMLTIRTPVKRKKQMRSRKQKVSFILFSVTVICWYYYTVL